MRCIHSVIKVGFEKFGVICGQIGTRRRCGDFWARSTSEYLSYLRTTMNVENFWKQLKHEYLHHYAHPRLDQLVWNLIYRVTPLYLARMEILKDTHHSGGSKPLTIYPHYFKEFWLKLLDAQLRSNVNKYITDVKKWTCTYGRQKYDGRHFCKHIVPAIGLPSPTFWCQVIRRRSKSLYQHPELVDKRQEASVLRTTYA